MIDSCIGIGLAGLLLFGLGAIAYFLLRCLRFNRPRYTDTSIAPPPVGVTTRIMEYL